MKLPKYTISTTIGIILAGLEIYYYDQIVEFMANHIFGMSLQYVYNIPIADAPAWFYFQAFRIFNLAFLVLIVYKLWIDIKRENEPTGKVVS